MPSVLHYGAVPRSYSHPRARDALTGLRGDGDTLDVVDVSALPATPGEVYWVKVLGALAMEDGGAADWKIVAIRASDPRARGLSGERAPPPSRATAPAPRASTSACSKAAPVATSSPTAPS
jgi:inorganic pyrophosphatase